MHAAETRAAPPTTPALKFADTGLYLDGSSDRVHPDNLEFTPQYSLWADGATKRRWLNLPPGTYVDAARPDAWEFPPGTRLWKEFSVEGRRIETRLIERRADKSWSYLSYVWNANGSDAVLAPARGMALSDIGGPAGRYIVPSRGDCLVCHEGAAVPVLGFSSVQLSRERERDPSNGVAVDVSLVDLEGLVAKGLLRNLTPAWLVQPPQIAARSPVERAALGYLHANCGHCHNHNGAPAAVRPVLAQTADLHIALEVEFGALQPMLAKGHANDIEVRGPSDHGMIDSIYFRDPTATSSSCAPNAPTTTTDESEAQRRPRKTAALDEREGGPAILMPRRRCVIAASCAGTQHLSLRLKVRQGHDGLTNPGVPATFGRFIGDGRRESRRGETRKQSQQRRHHVQKDHQEDVG